MDDKKPAIPITAMPKAVAGESTTSGSAVAVRRIEHTMLVRIIISGARHVATKGMTITLSGTSIKIGDAGLKRVPSHQTGRPIVRLLIATAIKAARTVIQVTKEIERQPGEGSLGCVDGKLGGVNSTLSTVHIQKRRQALISTNLCR